MKIWENHTISVGRAARALAAVLVTVVFTSAAVAADGNLNALLLEADRQLKAGDYSAALTTVEHGETLLTKASDPAMAVNFYVRHAFALMALDEYVDARRKLFDGLRLLEGYDGEISPDFEFALRDMVLEFAKQAREYDHGNRAAREAYRARERAYGKNSIETAAARQQQAEWYFFSSQFNRAAKHYEFAVEILDKVVGPTAEQLYQPLTLLARSHIVGNRKPEKIRHALERILELKFANPADENNARSQALAQLGDMQVIFNDSASSSDYYRQAWQAKKNALQGDVARTNHSFARPLQLRFKMPDTPARSSRGAEYFGEGFVLFEFTVSADGTLADVQIVESRPGNDFDVPGIRAMRKAKYRPRIRDGEPVDTPGIQFKTVYTVDDR